MGIVSIPQPEYGMSITDLTDIVARQSKMLEFLVNGRIDSANVREIAGFNVSATTFKHKSGIVGMSSSGSLGSAVRFWAGNADPNFAPFRVTQDGTMYATNGNFTGTITGSLIQSALPGTYPRTEISSSSNFIAAYQSASNYIDIESGPLSGNPSLNFKSPLGQGSWQILSNILSLLTPVGSLSISLSSGVDLTLAANNILKLSGSSLTINGVAGYSGSFSVITGVNFTTSTTTSKTVTVNKGIVTSVA